MNDSVSSDQTESTNTPSVTSVPENSQVVQAAPQKSGGKGLSVFAILLSLAALGGSGYSIYTTEVKNKLDESDLAGNVISIGGNVSRLGDSIANLKSQQDNVVSKEFLATSLLQSSNTADLRFRDIEQDQKELLGAVEKLNADMQRGINEFVVDEVSQLLKLANNSALFSGDARAAIKALQLADIQLKEMADPRFAIVRRKINEEIGVLESVAQVDVSSVTVKLKTLAGRVPSLKLENDTPLLGEVVVDVEESAKGWLGVLKQMWADIIDSVSVHKIDQAPKPLLVPEQRYFLDQNIQLQLLKAEIGLIQNNSLAYNDSLSAASTWLKEFFDTRDSSVQEVIAQIEALKNEALGEDLPSISGSYSMLQSIKGGQ